MPTLDHNHRRSFTQYLAAIFRVNWRTDDMAATASDLDDWWDEMSTYLTAAAAEYPALHPDRGTYELARQNLLRCVEGFTRFPRDLLGRPPAVVVAQVDQVYDQSGVANVAQLPAAPQNHTREWVGNNYFFVNSAIALDAQDLTSLYAAMIQDPSSGVTTNVGGQARHQTSNASGNTNGMIWYTHQYGRNRLLAVGACNPGARTITVLRKGDVNNGVHRF